MPCCASATDESVVTGGQTDTRVGDRTKLALPAGTGPEEADLKQASGQCAFVAFGGGSRIGGDRDTVHTGKLDPSTHFWTPPDFMPSCY